MADRLKFAETLLAFAELRLRTIASGLTISPAAIAEDALQEIQLRRDAQRQKDHDG